MRSMQPVVFFATLGIVSALGVLGAMCLFRPGVLVDLSQRNYERRKMTRAWPFSNLVLKPWYPTYLRFMGLFVWAFDLLFIYAIFFAHAGD